VHILCTFYFDSGEFAKWTLLAEVTLPQELTSRPSHQAPLQVGDSNFDSAIHINDDDDDDGMDSLDYESFPPGSNLVGDEEVASTIRQ